MLRLGHRFRMVRVVRVGGRCHQLVGVYTAAVLGRAVAPPVGADCSRRWSRPGADGFELYDMLPAIAEVVLVVQLVTRIGQHLVDAYLFLGDANVSLVHLERAQVKLGLRTVRARAGTELVQVTIGPAERLLDNLVQLVEEQIRRQLQPAPERRPGPLQVDPDAVRYNVRPARAPA